MKETKILLRVLLGLLMLVPGLTKLIGALNGGGPAGMLSNMFLFAWAPVFWAWVLIVAEVGCGLALLANYKVKYTAIPPIVVMLVAVLFINIKWANLGTTQWTSVLFHLIAAVGYLDLIEKK